MLQSEVFQSFLRFAAIAVLYFTSFLTKCFNTETIVKTPFV